jgi:hypothetical protein
MNFLKLQDLARAGKLPKQIADCEPPVCCSCQLGKANRHPETSVHKARPIDAENLLPGDRVSVDQIESPAPGMVDIFLGKPTSAKFHAALLYTDHASIYMYIKCNYSTGDEEAINGNTNLSNWQRPLVSKSRHIGLTMASCPKRIFCRMSWPTSRP